MTCCSKLLKLIFFNNLYITLTYRIAGNFRGVLIFVIFVTIPRVTKFSTHEFFHPRIFSRLLTSFAYRASGVTKFKTTKINSEDPRQLFTKICTPENYPLYGIYFPKQLKFHGLVWWLGGFIFRSFSLFLYFVLSIPFIQQYFMHMECHATLQVSLQLEVIMVELR